MYFRGPAPYTTKDENLLSLKLDTPTRSQKMAISVEKPPPNDQPHHT